MKVLPLHGEYAVCLQDGTTARAYLPGTLDTNRIGEREREAQKWHPDAEIDESGAFCVDGRILTRLTRIHAYKGIAQFSRTVSLEKRERTRLFVEAERSRDLTLRVNGEDVPHYEVGSISTPHVFEITQFAKDGENEICFSCDNAYNRWPHDPILFSSAATDETQTNWNGIIGYLQVREEAECFISAIRVYPFARSVNLAIDVDCAYGTEDELCIESQAFGTVRKQVSLRKGRKTVWIRGVALKDGVRYWDEEEGNLYEVCAYGTNFERKTATFGVRTVGSVGGRLALNGRKIFLRCETNTALFPETGHWPMDKQSWKAVLETYRAYGVNCVRFHSHCPPEAAFAAADEMGMLMQPELSHWNPKTAFEKEEDYLYFRHELTQVLKYFCNHPSFITFTFGNELWAESRGHKRMDVLLAYAKKTDATRLFANGSNNHYGCIGPDMQSDFYTGTNFYQHELRATFANMGGYLNRDYPSATHDFNGTMKLLREEYSKPVIEFEVGQYEILPDFGEIDDFRGVTYPDNIIYVRERAEKFGLMGEWNDYLSATGELSLLCYREEVEACLRTPEMSGISLLGLQDFAGQGTSLVGMLNSHLESKPFPFAQPERFSAFFASVLPLAFLNKYTYYEGETLSFELKFANYGKQSAVGKATVLLEEEEGGTVLFRKQLDEKEYKAGRLHRVGNVSFALPQVAQSKKYRLTVRIADAVNEYPVWIYKKERWSVPEGVTVTDSLEVAIGRLREGASVILNPVSDEEHFPQSIQAQFSTDFWSVGNFPQQSGFMGCYVQPSHPAFAQFPTEFHSNWQWWKLSSNRALVLPGKYKSLVKGLDCYARMRNLSLLFEVRVGKGKLLVSSMNLLQDEGYPEVNAMLTSLCAYAASKAFAPTQSMTEEELNTFVR